MTDINQPLSLDDLYKMVAYIYSEKNATRSPQSTFAHFVEVCGMLTIHDRKKKREGIDVTDALCKALGWYFPLLAKMRIQSVEELVFRKFPKVCPYCRSAPHKEAACKLVRGTDPTVNHSEVSRHFQRNWTDRPKNLDEWQSMFQSIYPRSLDEHGRSTIGLLEELGELAEAVRVYDQYPKYFLGEAADTFSYIMGIANEHSIRLAQDGKSFSFEAEFLTRYPGLCIQCGSRLCVCPAVPEATVGRMAKEMNIAEGENPFIANVEAFSAQGRQVGHQVLETVGGHRGLSARLPFERGDANKALIALCLQIADAIEAGNRGLAETLRGEALKMATSAQKPGTPRKPIDVDALLAKLEAVWKDLDDVLRSNIRKSEGLVGELGDILETIRVLFVFCSPTDEKAIRVNAELRVIQDCIKHVNSTNVMVHPLPAATATDLRRELLDKRYDIIHFAGHAGNGELVFENEQGESSPVPLSAIAESVARSPSVKAVILNACESIKNVTEVISPFTIGMDDTVSDAVALEFSRGFYDAVVRKKSVREAYQEGLTAVRMAGFDASKIRLMMK